MTEILRFTQQDVEVAKEAQLRWELQQQAYKDAGLENSTVIEEIRAVSDQERKNMFVALGLENPDESDILI